MIEKFYKDILPDDDSYKLLWTLNDKTSHWFQDVDELIKFVKENPTNIFLGLGVTNTKFPSNKRATAKAITSIRCLHNDIDIKDKSIHKNSKLPTTIAEAQNMGKSILEPTWIINSGHGLHPYYCCNEHQKISEKNFEFWTNLSRAWQRTLNQKFPQYELDATHDLSRILRCPGSLNAKDSKDIVKCEIIEHNETAYYEQEEIEDAISFSMSKERKLQAMQKPKENSIPATQIATKIRNYDRLSHPECEQWLSDNGILFTEDRKLSDEKFQYIQSMEPEFFQEFCNKTKRKSASEWQFRIANIAVKNGFSDQHVIDVMIQHRSFNKHDIEIHRADKYVNDLLKVRKYHNIQRISSSNNEDTEVTPADKEAVRRHLYNKLGIQIHTLWRYHRDPENYFELELSDSPGKLIYLGGMTDGIMNQKKFIGSIISSAGKVPKALKSNKWYFDVVQNLNMLTKDGKTQDTATFEGQVKTWVQEYLFQKEIIESMPMYIENNVRSNPFYHRDFVFFQFEDLVRWITTTKSENFDSFHFNITMSKNGFKKTTVKGRNGFPIALWKTPPNYFVRNVSESE